MDVYVAAEGYTLSYGYLLKELCITYPNSEYTHYLFKIPEEISLSALDQKTVRYVTRNISKLSYNDGEFPYQNIGIILNKLKDYTIYTYSIVVEKLIQEFLPTTIVINTQDLGHTLPKTLPDPSCFRQHSYRYCAKAKSIAIKNFIENEATM